MPATRALTPLLTVHPQHVLHSNASALCSKTSPSPRNPHPSFTYLTAAPALLHYSPPPRSSQSPASSSLPGQAPSRFVPHAQPQRPAAPEGYRDWTYVSYNAQHRATQPHQSTSANLQQHLPYTPTTNYLLTPHRNACSPNSTPCSPLPPSSSRSASSLNLYASLSACPASLLRPPSARALNLPPLAVRIAERGKRAVLPRFGSGVPGRGQLRELQHPDQTGTLEPESQPVPGFTNARSSYASSANLGCAPALLTSLLLSRAQVDDTSRSR